MQECTRPAFLGIVYVGSGDCTTEGDESDNPTSLLLKLSHLRGFCPLYCNPPDKLVDLPFSLFQINY